MKLMVIGFPKSGTTTITRALEASGMKAAHWQDGSGRFVGALIYHAVLNGADPFVGLPGYDAVTQADVCLPAQGANFWPNLDFSILRAVRAAHPRCLFLLNYRQPEAIVESIVKWPNLQRRLEYAEIPGLPRGYGGERRHLRAWIENHFAACRSLFRTDDHFLEIDIGSPDAADLLGSKLGTPVRGWGDFKPSSTDPNDWVRHG